MYSNGLQHTLASFVCVCVQICFYTHSCTCIQMRFYTHSLRSFVCVCVYSNVFLHTRFARVCVVMWKDGPETYEQFLAVCMRVRQELVTAESMRLNPESLILLAENRVVLTHKEGNIRLSRIICTLCGYYTSDLPKMEYHCKLGTHRYFLSQERPILPLKIRSTPTPPPRPIPDPKQPPSLQVPLKQVLECILDQTEPLTQRQAIELFYEASLDPTPGLRCEVCAIECKTSREYSLHVRSFPHMSRIKTLNKLKVKYMQPFLNPSNSKIYFLSVIDNKIVIDAGSVMNSHKDWVGYSGINRLSLLEPRKLHHILHDHAVR